MVEKIEALSVEQLKRGNRLLGFASALVSMGLTSLVIALNFGILKPNTSGAARWTGIGLILFIIVFIAGLRKISKWIKGLEYSDLRQFILLLISFVPIIISAVVAGLINYHFEKTIQCIYWLIGLFAADKIVLYYKSFFEYELEIVKKAKEAEKIDKRRAKL